MPLKQLQRLVAAAAAAGLIAGLLLTAMQLVAIEPLIRAAEAYETTHDGAPPPIFATALADVALAIGFGLFLVAGMSLRASGGWRAGLLWGVAGYFAFFVAPSLGLPPELPGAEAAPLADRQLWWLAAVACSAAGLAMIVFSRSNVVRAIGVALIVAPHAMGAPQAAIGASTAPAELAASFARASYLCNAVFWLALGALAGFFAPRAPLGAEDCSRTSNSTV